MKDFGLGSYHWHSHHPASKRYKVETLEREDACEKCLKTFIYIIVFPNGTWNTEVFTLYPFWKSSLF